jgi:hypothetical protein
MTKLIQSQPSEISLADYTQQIFEEMPEVAGNEKDYNVSGNLITITFGSEYGDFKLSVLVSFEDNAQSLHERFTALLTDHLNDIESFERWEADNYEHASHTQGYAFDLLTLK